MSLQDDIPKPKPTRWERFCKWTNELDLDDVFGLAIVLALIIGFTAAIIGIMFAPISLYEKFIWVAALMTVTTIGLCMAKALSGDMW